MESVGQRTTGPAGRSWREALLGAACGLALVATALALPQPPAPPASAIGLPTVGAVRQGTLAGDPAALFGSGIAVDFVNGQDGWAVVALAGGVALCGRAPFGTAQAAPPPCSVLATTDGGADWMTTALRTDRQLTSVHFVDPLDGVAWGPDALFSTSDGGARWTTQGAGAVPSSLDLVTASRLWGVAGGALESSADLGAAWSVALRTPACTFTSVSFADPEDGWAVGTSPAGVCLFTTTDGGVTWSPVFETLSGGPAATAFSHYVEEDFGRVSPRVWEAQSAAAAPWGVCADGQVARTSASAGWLALTWCGANTGAETVLRTADGGRTWTFAWGMAGCLMGCRSSGGGAAPAFFLNATTAWMWAPFGVARTVDGGTTWSRTAAQFCGASCTMPGPSGAGALCVEAQCGNSVSFVNADAGWAASPEGLFATTDGGQVWLRQWPAPSLPGPLAAMSFVSVSTGFAIPLGRPEAPVETGDGGREWTALRAPLPGQALAGLSFRSTTSGCVWSSRALACTGDGGSTWRRVRTPNAEQDIVGAGFVDAKHRWVASYGGTLWFTGDGGSVWRRAAAFPGGRRGNAAGFVLAGGGVGWALVAETPGRRPPPVPALTLGAWSLDRTLDGGRSWTMVATWSAPGPDTGPLLRPAPLSAAGRQRVWLLSAAGDLLGTTDGGRRWRDLRVAGLGALQPSALQFVSPNDGWMLTGGGGLLKTADGGQMWDAVPV